MRKKERYYQVVTRTGSSCNSIARYVDPGDKNSVRIMNDTGHSFYAALSAINIILSSKPMTVDDVAKFKAAALKKGRQFLKVSIDEF